MDKTQALEKLRSIGQQHLFKLFEELSPEEQRQLLDQIDALNIPTFRIQQQMLKSREQHPIRFLEPFRNAALRGNADDTAAGRKLIAEGKVGCMIIAGGQGTRLKMDGPKGMCPVSLIRKKSLFQLFAEKTLAAGRLAGRKLPLAVMTSPLNHNQTLDYFAENQLFGLDPQQLDFFIQGMLPMLDSQGNLLMDRKGHIAEGPNGNGNSLSEFYESGIWHVWYNAGVRYINFVPIDNPLADPFDAELVGHHHNRGSEVMVKCTDRKSPEENVGVLVKHEGKVKVIEYTELPEDEKTAAGADGQLKYRCANLSLFSFSMDFIKRVSKAELPLHLAHKASPYFDATGKEVQPNGPNVWKFEKFIFDLLPLSLKAEALLYPREECFAPLKNSHGDASIEEVQKALQERDRAVIRKITGKEPPDFPFELSQDFYYPTEELRNHWRGKALTDGGYISPS